MYEGIYSVFIRSLCILVDILTVCYSRLLIFFNIKYEHSITLNIHRFITHSVYNFDYCKESA